MGNVEMIKQLLAKNARIDEHGYVCCMPSKCMHLHQLYTILQKKSTALHMAARHAHVAVLRILLEAQANTNLKDEVLNLHSL